jgi:CRP-like cAMP-binding protein
MSESENTPSRGPGAVPTRALPVPCARCPLRRLPAFRTFNEPELAFVQAFKAGELTVTAGHDILLAGHNNAQVFTLLRGWAFRYILMPDGGRQILNFVLPGDFLGLQTSVFDVMEHSVEALTDVQLCLFPRKELWSLYRDQPGLAFDVTWLAAHEESLVDDNLASVGRRNALGRIAFLLLHLFRRLEGLAQVAGDACAFPLTQQHIADATGLSLVHTNKTLRKLVRGKLVELGGGRLRLLGRDGLERLAGDPGREPRPRPFI